MPKPLTVDHNKSWKILKEMGIPDHLTCLLRNLYPGQKAAVRTEHGKTNWFQIGKEYVKAVYCHPSYLTYMQSTSRETLGWRKHKLESRLSGEISVTSDMQMTPYLWLKWRRTKKPLDESERAEQKFGLKLNIQKIKIMASNSMDMVLGGLWELGVGDGQGGLASCGSWVTKSWTPLSDWTKLNCLFLKNKF